MSEIAVQEVTPASVATYVPPALGAPGVDLTNYYNRMSTAIQIAQPMCMTPFVPSAFKNKPEDTAMAIMYGLKYGMEPDAALSAIFLIGGRPGMYSRVQHAILLANGHEVVVVKQSETECIVKGRRKGTEDWTTSEWTTARAERAGYFSNAKYKTDPVAMLTARALGDVCRLVAPDLLMGITAYNEADIEPLREVTYNGDTLEPIKETVTRPITSASRVNLQVVRPFAEPAPAAAPAAPLVAAEAAAEAEDDTVDEEPETAAPAPAPAQPTGELVSNQIAGILDKMLTAGGLRTKVAKLTAAREFAGRHLDTVMDLTAAEADVWGQSLRAALDATTAALNPETAPEPSDQTPAPEAAAEAPQLDSWGYPITAPATTEGN